MNYKLYFFDQRKPPLLVPNVAAGFGMVPLVENNYVIGSVEAIDESGRLNRNFVPDPNWRLYPKIEYYTARNMYPRTWAFTDIPYDNEHFLYYFPITPLSESYSIRLANHYEDKIRNARPVPPPKDIKALKENLSDKKKLLKEQQKYLEDYQKEESKIKTSVKRYKRRTNLDANEAGELNRFTIIQDQYGASISGIKNNIKSIKDDIKILETEIKQI